MAWASLNEQLRDVAAGFAGAPLENPAAVSVVLAQLASLVDGPFGSILDGVAPDPTGDEAEALGRWAGALHYVEPAARVGKSKAATPQPPPHARTSGATSLFLSAGPSP